MNLSLKQIFHNGAITLIFNQKLNIIEEINVFHKDSFDVILRLGYVISSKKTLTESFPAGNDLNQSYDYINLKQEAYALFISDNVNLDVLQSLGYKS